VGGTPLLLATAPLLLLAPATPEDEMATPDEEALTAAPDDEMATPDEDAFPATPDDDATTDEPTAPLDENPLDAAMLLPATLLPAMLLPAMLDTFNTLLAFNVLLRVSVNEKVLLEHWNRVIR
jgi:hypothetical protein